MATAFGGLWKTTNRGTTFTPIFDEASSFTLCCVVVDPKDSNVVWLGSGENASQRSAHFGDGIYKSTDAGKTWKRMGLEKSEHLGQILIDPRNSNIVYVAAQGPLWSAGGERGLYKTTDGGNKWDRVLHVSDDTGISDIVFDTKNPDVIYASSYQRRRQVGQMIGGGPEGGIWKTTDAGKKWTKLANGLPKDDVGRIALGVDPKNPKRVYALISAKMPRGGRGGVPGAAAPQAAPSGPVVDEQGFYRSDDAGATWARVGKVAPTQGRGGPPTPGGDWYRGGGAAYYQEIFVDPYRADWIWSVNTNLNVSKDGGKTWETPNFEDKTGMHVDHHVVRFDPSDPKHILIGNDGGVYETYDEGQTFRFFANLPVTQYLPRVHGQREAVLPRVRRRAGQLVALRSGREYKPLGRAHERLVHRGRGRRFPDAQRSGRSQHRLRDVAGRQRDASRSADRDVARHSSTRRAGVQRR